MNREDRKQSLMAFHRENIVTAAEGLFKAKGYESTTVDDIARAAEYSKRTVYSYFESKYEIYCHMVLRGITMLKDYIAEGVGKSDEFTRQYRDICESLLAFYRDHPLYFNAVVQFQSTPIFTENPPQVAVDIFNKGEELNALLAKAFENGQRQGVLRADVKIVESIFIYWSSISALITLAHHKESYLEETMGTTRQDFLNYGFELLLSAVLKR